MAKRKSNYSNYTRNAVRPSNNGGLKRSTKVLKVAKIEKIENTQRKINLTFEGGTRYSISESDEKYRYSNYFNVLWSELKEGMIAEIDLYGMKILDVQIDIPQ